MKPYFFKGKNGIWCSEERRNFMTRTVLSSATKEIVIGFDAPFCVIGERINPTGRKLLAEEMANGNYNRV